MARDRTAVLLKESIAGWNYTRALDFIRKRREEILKIQRADGTTFPEAAFKLAQQVTGDTEE